MKAIITRGRRLRLVKPPQVASQPKISSSGQQQQLPSSPPKKLRTNDYSSSDRSPSTEDDQLPSFAFDADNIKPPPPNLPPHGRSGSTSSLSTRHNSSMTPSSSGCSPTTPFLQGEDSWARPPSDVAPASHVARRSLAPPPVPAAIDDAGPSTLLPPPQSSQTRWSGGSGSAPAPQTGGGASWVAARRGPPFRHQEWRPLQSFSSLPSLATHGVLREPSARYLHTPDRTRLPMPATAYPPASSSPIISQRRQSDQYQQQQQYSNASASGSRPQPQPSRAHLMSSLGVRSSASQSMPSPMSPYSTAPTCLHQENSAGAAVRSNTDSSSMIEATDPPPRRASLVSSTSSSSTSSSEAGGSTRMTLPPIRHLLQAADQGILPEGPTSLDHGLASSRYPTSRDRADGHQQQGDDHGQSSTTPWTAPRSAERHTQQQDYHPRATPFRHTQTPTTAISNPSLAPFQPRRRFEPLQPPPPPPPHRHYTQDQIQGSSSTPEEFYDPVHSAAPPPPSSSLLHSRNQGEDERMSSPHLQPVQLSTLPRRRYMDEDESRGCG